jgi:hypothetical protein
VQGDLNAEEWQKKQTCALRSMDAQLLVSRTTQSSILVFIEASCEFVGIIVMNDPLFEL